VQSNSYSTFCINLTTRKVVSCSRFPQAEGVDLSAYLRDYISGAALNDPSVKFDYVELEAFICQNGEHRAMIVNSPASGKSYRFLAYTDSSDKNKVYCSLFIAFSADKNDPYIYDYLTGVYSCSYAVETIEKRFSKVSSGALLIVDVDNFKKVNDTFSRSVGDECLRKFSREISDVCKDCVVGRYGGDEFVVWVEEASESDLSGIITKLLDIRYEAAEGKLGKKITVTCSVGAAEYPTDAKNFVKLFYKADKALSKAKRVSKNSAGIFGKEAFIHNGKDVFERRKLLHSGSERLFNQELNFIKIRSAAMCVALAILFAILSIVVGIRYNSYALTLAKNEAGENMSSFAAQISTYLSDTIESYFVQLSMSAESINSQIDDTLFDADEVDGVLLKASENTKFLKVGVLFESGELYFSTNENYSMTIKDYVKRIMSGEQEGYVDNVNLISVGERILFGRRYEYESNYENPVVGVVGLIEPETLGTFLNAQMFKNSSVYITEADGASVAANSDIAEEFDTDNILDLLKSNSSSDAYAEAVAGLKNGSSGTLELKMGVASYLLYYTSAGAFSAEARGINTVSDDWRIVIIVPAIEVENNIMSMYYMTFFSSIALLFALWVAATISCVMLARMEIKNKKLMYVDPITGGINSERFIIDAATLARKNRYAIVTINVVHFKYVNEQVGHDVANDILFNIHRDILSKLGDGELISREYADHFTMLMRVDKILKNRVNAVHAMLNGAHYAGRKLSLKFTAGVYILPEETTDEKAELSIGFDRALFALMQTDEAENPIVCFNDSMLVKEIEDVELEQRGEQALRDGQFVVYYQLKRDIIHDKWCGSEALVRWVDPVAGIISPGRFIPVFERNGFIVELDKYVFGRVCRDIRYDIDIGKKPLPVSVNVSRKHFVNDNFLDEYETIMENYKIPRSLIEFELTESIVMESEAILKRFIKRVHDMGCKCSIDDFGSGYSSLNMLKEFNFDVVKFDRGFFYGDNGFDSDSQTIVFSLINLSHELGMKVVSEGIEQVEQRDFLLAHKCDMVQGFLYSKPVPHSEYVKNLDDAGNANEEK